MDMLKIERMERGNPQSLYRATIGEKVIEGLTYQEAIEMMVRIRVELARVKIEKALERMREGQYEMKQPGGRTRIDDLKCICGGTQYFLPS